MIKENNLLEEIKTILKDELTLVEQKKLLIDSGFEIQTENRNYLRVSNEENEILKLYQRAHNYLKEAMKYQIDNYKEGIRELQYGVAIIWEIAKNSPKPKIPWEKGYKIIEIADKWAVENNDMKLREEIYKQYRNVLKEATTLKS